MKVCTNTINKLSLLQSLVGYLIFKQSCHLLQFGFGCNFSMFTYNYVHIYTYAYIYIYICIYTCICNMFIPQIKEKCHCINVILHWLWNVNKIYALISVCLSCKDIPQNSQTVRWQDETTALYVQPPQTQYQLWVLILKLRFMLRVQ